MASRRDTAIREFTVAALDAEASSAAALCALLGVAEPVSWPPEYNDADTRAWFRAQLATRPDAAGWLGYYVVAGIDGVPTLVGTAGYKGPPDREGMVEIGYSVVKTYRRRGIATAALELLLERAFNDARVVTVSAETRPVSPLRAGCWKSAASSSPARAMTPKRETWWFTRYGDRRREIGRPSVR